MSSMRGQLLVVAMGFLGSFCGVRALRGGPDGSRSTEPGQRARALSAGWSRHRWERLLQRLHGVARDDN